MTEAGERVVAENMRAERQRRRMSVREVGDMLGVSGNWVSERETGKRAITVNNAFAIAAAFGIRIGALLGIEDRHIPPFMDKILDDYQDPATTDWERQQLLAVVRDGHRFWDTMRRGER